MEKGKSMPVEHSGDSRGGVFFIDEDGVRKGLMSYYYAGSQLIVIDHTEVSPEFNGQGIGKQLVAAGVAYAREKGFRIIPTCPFAKAEFTKHAEYGDVLST